MISRVRRVAGPWLAVVGVLLPGCSDEGREADTRTRAPDPREETEARGRLPVGEWSASTSIDGTKVCLSIRHQAGSGGGCAPPPDGRPRIFVTEIGSARFTAGIVRGGTESLEVISPHEPPRGTTLHPVAAKSEERPAASRLQYFVFATDRAEPRPTAVREHRDDRGTAHFPLPKGPIR
jgi:hypothetical protein